MRVLAPILAASLCACATSGPRPHVSTYANGAPRWQTELADGVPHGPSTTWHPNGQVASRGNFVAGERHGTFVYYDLGGHELARRHYRHGHRIDGPPAGVSSPALALAAHAPVAEEPASDHYVDLRLAVGGGATDAAHRMGDSTPRDGSAALSLSVTSRRGTMIYGVSGSTGGTIFGPGHTYVGGLVGAATGGPRAHVELLGEAGVHTASGLGDDLFTTSAGNTSVMLPYAGAQARLSFDPGDLGHLVFDLTVAGRTDLSRAETQVTTTTCFFGCSSERESWRIGGTSVDVTLGFGYRFR